MKSLLRLAETVRRLRPSQVGHRIVARLARGRAVAVPRVTPVPLPPLPAASRRPTLRPFDGPDGTGWRFAGRRAVPDGARLVWDGEPSLLQRYHAAYAEVVRATAEAGDLDGARRWLAAVVPGAPSHPYVRARRVLALVEARSAGLVEVDPVVAADAEALVRRPEWDVRGNHLVCNGAALVRAGAAFAGPAARRWARRGAAVLSTCVADQVLPDGLHFERSPVYHALVLEHLLVALASAAARGESPPRGVAAAAAAMTRALDGLELPDGAPVRWRDGAPGVALPFAALRAWAHERGLDHAGGGDGLVEGGDARRGPRTFPAAGLAVVADPSTRCAVTLVVAPPCPADLPAHGHADALSYEAVLGGTRVVAAAGTAAYGAGPARDRDRRPGAFAGATLDGVAPADPYGAFRVGARGFVRRLETGVTKGWRFAVGVSGGFHDAVPHAVHRRVVALSPAGTLVVVDEWTGDGTHRVDAFLPLAPGFTATPDAEGALVVGAGRARRLSAPGATVTLEEGFYAEGLGAAVARPVLRLAAVGPLPMRRLHAWTDGPTPASVHATPIAGGELRVVVARGSVVETGWVPAGRPA